MRDVPLADFSETSPTYEEKDPNTYTIDWQLYQAGGLFLHSSLDALAAHNTFSPNIFHFWESLLCIGSKGSLLNPSSDCVDGFTEPRAKTDFNAKKAAGAKDAKADKLHGSTLGAAKEKKAKVLSSTYEEDSITSIPPELSQPQRIIDPLNVSESTEESTILFDKIDNPFMFWNTTFGEIFQGLLRNLGVICIGIYKYCPDRQMYKAVIPDHEAIVESEDKLFILKPSVDKPLNAELN